MAVDTRSKRASVVSLLVGFAVLAPPLPDATLDQGDRQHIAWAYSGIAAASPSGAADRNYVLHKDDTVDRGAIWRPISGTTAASFTAGSILFAGPAGTVIAQDNANLFWDDTNNRLGVGTNVPDAPVHLKAGAPAMYIHIQSTGAGAAVQMDKAAAGNDATCQYLVGGVQKWKIGMIGAAPSSLGSNWGVWDHVGAAWALTIDTSRRVGIGTGLTTVNNLLDVRGTVESTGIKMTTAPGAGLVLTSDAAGVGSWATGPGTQWAGGSDNATVATGATVYGLGSGSQVMSATDVSAGTRSTVARAGTVGNLRVTASASHVAGDNVYTVMKNGVATAVTCTLTGAGTTGSDTVNSFAVVAGDEIGIRLETSADGSAVAVKHSWSITISD